MRKTTNTLLIAIILIISITQIGRAEMDSIKPEKNNELSWMVGHWQGEAFGGICEEVWQPMTAGTMCGTFKLIVDGKVVFYELMIIEQLDSGYSMNLKHFNADMTGWEEKDKVISFPYKSVEENFIRFDGITYERVADDKLQIIVMTGQSDSKFHKVIIDCVKK